MSGMDIKVENICGLLIGSRLMTPDEMKAMRQRWLEESKTDAENVALFLRWLLDRQYVTEFQLNLLAKGRTDGYFLGRYKILERIGKGRMAGVYRAVHQLGQVVAIKVLPPSRAKDPHLMGRFQREARLALRLKHPNVVRAFQIGHDNAHYLVMEYLQGETLDEVLQRRKRLPPNEAVRIIYQALLGLQHIHEQSMVHRDLKPANLMVVAPPGRTPGGNDGDTTLHSTVKILDIGLGREIFDDSEGAGGELQLTGEGVLLGTPDYLAPEQARDPSGIDIRADIYSLGCVLYQLLTGQPPFPDKNLLRQMVRHATEAPRPLSELSPATPDGLQQIVNWMLAKQAEQRYPTPERAAQALAVLLVAEEAEAAAGDEPQLRRYLTWLEAGGEEVPAAPPAVAAPATAATPVVVAVTAPAQPASAAAPVARAAAGMPVAQAVPARTAPAQPARPEKSKKPKRLREREAGYAPVAQPGPRTALPTAAPSSPPAAALVEFDVELVPISSLAGQGWQLSGRDWLLMGIGAGAAIIAMLVGLGLAIMLRP